MNPIYSAYHWDAHGRTSKSNLPRLAISAFCALRAFVPPADAPNAALRGSAVAASAAVAAASSALPAGAADEYLNYNTTGGVEMGRNG